MFGLTFDKHWSPGWRHPPLNPSLHLCRSESLNLLWRYFKDRVLLIQMLRVPCASCHCAKTYSMAWDCHQTASSYELIGWYYASWVFIAQYRCINVAKKKKKKSVSTGINIDAKEISVMHTCTNGSLSHQHSISQHVSISKLSHHLSCLCDPAAVAPSGPSVSVGIIVWCRLRPVTWQSSDRAQLTLCYVWFPDADTNQ